MQNKIGVTLKSGFLARAASILVISLAALVLTAAPSFAAVIDGTDYTTSPPTPTTTTFTSIDVATPITGEDSVYLAFTVDTDFDVTQPANGFDLFELLNSSGETVVSLTESGSGNTTWNANLVSTNGSTGFTTAANPDLTVVFKIDQVAEEAFLWINPNLGAEESANAPTLSFTGGDFSSLTTNNIDILRYRGGGNSPSILAFSNIALYTGNDSPFFIKPKGTVIMVR